MSLPRFPNEAMPRPKAIEKVTRPGNKIKGNFSNCVDCICFTCRLNMCNFSKVNHFNHLGHILRPVLMAIIFFLIKISYLITII